MRTKWLSWTTWLLVAVMLLSCRTGKGDGGATSILFVPIVLSSGGAGGSYYTSELVLTNRGSSAASLEIVYTAAFGGGSGSCSDVLAAGQQKVVPDTIAWLRDRGVPIPEGPGRGGNLHVTFAGLSSADAAAVTVRTTTATAAPQPAGAAGLAYPAVRPADAFTSSATLYGLRSTAEDRSNVAVYNPSLSPVTVRVTAFAGDGSGNAVVKEPSLELAPLDWVQLSSVFDGTSITNGWVTIERTSGSGSFGAYGVVNDNGTSDGSFVSPVADTLAGSSITVPALVETTSGYSSELVLANRSEAVATLNLTYNESLSPTLGAGGSFAFELAPRTQLIVPDAVDWLRGKGVALGARGAAGYAGALRVSVAGAALGKVFAGARTAARSPFRGQFGLFTPGNYEGQEASTEAFLYGLRADELNRTNIAVVNAGSPSAGAVTLELQAFDGDAGGVPRGTADETTLRAGEWFQASAFLGSKGVPNGWVRVRRLSGSAPWIAYGVVNDGGNPGQRTGDGAFVPMVTASEEPACPWELSTLTDGGWVSLNGFTFDGAGRPAVSYSSGGQTKLARWDPGSSSWAIQGGIPGGGGLFGFDTRDGGASLVSNSSLSNRGTLDFVHWNGSSWTVETIDNRWSDFYSFCSARFDPSGLPAVSYTPSAAGVLFARRSGSTWVVETVDPRGGWFNSLAFDRSGEPAIAYSVGGTDLMFGRRSNGLWIPEIVVSRPAPAPGDNAPLGWYLAMAFDSFGRPAIVQRSNGIGVQYWWRDGDQWRSELVSNLEGSGNSLAFGRSGRPVVAFGKSGLLWIAERTAAGEWRLQSIDQADEVSGTRMALDSAGNPAIAYTRVVKGVQMIGLARRQCP